MKDKDLRVGIAVTVVIAVVIVLAVAACICLIPRTTKVEQKMYGAVVNDAGEVQELVEFSVTGKLSDYLLKDDPKMDLNIEFLSGNAPSLMYIQPAGSRLYPAPEYFITGLAAYDSYANRYTALYFGMTEDRDYCLLTIPSSVPGRPTQYLVGSTKQDFDAKEILSAFPILTEK